MVVYTFVQIKCKQYHWCNKCYNIKRIVLQLIYFYLFYQLNPKWITKQYGLSHMYTHLFLSFIDISNTDHGKTLISTVVNCNFFDKTFKIIFKL